MSAQNDLQLIQNIINSLNENPVARFSYRQEAFDEDIIDGVDAFDRNAKQNIPKANYTDYNPTVLDYGVRTQGASIPRMGWNHYIGRGSFNLNKLIQKMLAFIGISRASMAHNAFEYDSAAKYRTGDVCYAVKTVNNIKIYAWYYRASLSPETIQGISPAASFHWSPMQEASPLDSKLPISAPGFRHRFTIVDLADPAYDADYWYPCITDSFIISPDSDANPLQVLFEVFSEGLGYKASLAIQSMFTGFAPSSTDIVFDCQHISLPDGEPLPSASGPIGYSKLPEDRKAVIWLKGGRKYALWNSYGANFYLDGDAPEAARPFEITPATICSKLKTPIAVSMDEAPNLGQVLGLIVDKSTPIKVQQYLALYHYSRYDALVRAQENVDIQTGGLLLLDGEQLAEDSVVFLTKQADKAENGIYGAKEGPWERLSGYGPADGQAFDHEYIRVLSGTDAGLLYCIKTERYEIGVDPIEFFESAFSPAKISSKIVIRDRDGNIECDGSGGNGGNGGDEEVDGLCLVTEEGDYIVTEEGDYIVIEEGEGYEDDNYLVTEEENCLVTEDDDYLIVE